MELIKPSFGLIFWMLIGFGIFFFILAKYVWPIITQGIASRNKKIQDQLDEAERVHAELENLNLMHEQMLAQAKTERDDILNEARAISEKLKEDAKLKADAEAQSIIADAKQAIQMEKMKAITDLKNEIANFSINIAEKIMTEELSDKERQEKLIEKWVDETNLN
ncbi:MAG: F0F1 ATP synthase subunit B [Bacteroidales bacterium]|jgi:F-type H+-transporting ATPase subunit b|nr:F0F1 ATP synthase subunit B [Bacteroidales bacterium]